MDYWNMKWIEKALFEVKEAGHKDHRLYNSIYIKCPEEAHPYRQKID